MNDSTFDKELILEKITENKVLNGYLELKVSEPITIDQIIVSIYLEARGRMSSQRDHQLTIKLKHPKVLDTFQSNKIHFSMELSNLPINTYSGKNVDITYTCNAKIVLNNEDLDKVDRSFFSKIKSFVTNDHSIKLTEYFEFPNPKKTYDVVEGTSTFKMQANIKPAFILGPIAAVIYYAFNYHNGNEAYVLTFFVFFGGTMFFIFVSMLLSQFIKGPSLEVYANNNAFSCKVTKKKLLPLKNQQLYYEIVERVVDTRGTKPSEEVVPLFTSEKQAIRKTLVSDKLRFNYTDVKALQSFKFNNASICWQMNLEGEVFYIFKYKYMCEFYVK